MRRLNIDLPKYRLFLQFKFIKRRKPLVAEPIIPTARIIRQKYKKGSHLGKLFRHVFEHKKIGRVLAGGLSIIVILGSYFPPSNNVQAQIASDEVVVASDVTLATEKSIQFPTGNVRVTQGYSFYHRGLDLDGLTGDPIKPIKPGKVSAISHSRFAYGNSVLIEHQNGVRSLYAHLSKIDVKTGQDVTMDTVIGEMGATGRASGDHLHLEIFDHGKAISPLSVLR